MATIHFNQTAKTIARQWEAFVSHDGMFPRIGVSPSDSRTTGAELGLHEAGSTNQTDPP